MRDVQPITISNRSSAATVCRILKSQRPERSGGKEPLLHYIYLNNIRGFSRTLVPIRSCNFLVGENSTGKSSFLSLLRLLSQPDFFFQSHIAFDGGDSASAFSDLVSAWAQDKTHFDIGVLEVDTEASGELKTHYRLHRFARNPALQCSVSTYSVGGQLGHTFVSLVVRPNTL